LVPDVWQEDVLEDWLGRRRDGRWAAATCGLAVPRQNGKNGGIEVRELFGMVALGEKFLHTAHEVKTARKAFLRIASFFENERQYPELAALVKEIRKTNGQEAVILTNGGSVEFIARSRGSGRGFTVDVLVCDEAQDLTDEELAALLPTISAAPTGNPQVIFTGTPPDPEKLGAQGEVFRRVRADGESGRDKRLAWTDFGVEDGPIPDVEDRGLWHRVNPALGIRLNVAEVERERALMSPDAFARERLGWWGNPASDGRAIPGPAWAGCLDEESRFGPGTTALGLYLTGDRARAYVGGVGQRGDGLLHVELVAECSTAEALDVVRRLAEKRNAPVVIDPGSHAGSFIQPLEDAGVTVEQITLQKIGQACGAFYDAVTERNLRHIGQGQLTAAVRDAATRPISRESWAWKGPTTTALYAVTFALHGYLKHATADYDVLESVY
jgi:phage terminase large subunit-like protein